jgi:hypothetical protein
MRVGKEELLGTSGVCVCVAGGDSSLSADLGHRPAGLPARTL